MSTLKYVCVVYDLTGSSLDYYSLCNLPKQMSDSHNRLASILLAH